MTTPNAELAYKVLDHIDAHPETWHQNQWLSRPDGADCGTKACFAGWACLLSGDKPWWEQPEWDEVSDYVTTIDGGRAEVRDRAVQLLGIGIGDADRVFDGWLGRFDLGDQVKQIFGPRPGGAA